MCCPQHQKTDQPLDLDTISNNNTDLVCLSSPWLQKKDQIMLRLVAYQERILISCACSHHDFRKQTKCSSLVTISKRQSAGWQSSQKMRFRPINQLFSTLLGMSTSILLAVWNQKCIRFYEECSPKNCALSLLVRLILTLMGEACKVIKILILSLE